MAKVKLDGAALVDEAAFHAASKKAFGFPEFYANTMDAWVDCLSYLRDEESMSTVQLGENEVLSIEIANAAAMQQQNPDLLEELTYLVGAINERYEDYGEAPALALKLT